MTIPAGWYDDGTGLQRWWDGAAWTGHTLAPSRAHATEETAPVATDAHGEEASIPAFAAPWVQPQSTESRAFSSPTVAYASPVSGPVEPHGSQVYGSPAAATSRRASPVGFIALGAALIGAVLSCIPPVAVAGWVLLALGFVAGLVSVFLPRAKWPGAAGMGVSTLGALLAVAVVLISSVTPGSVRPEADPPAGPGPSATPTDGPPDAFEDAEMVGYADLEVGQCMPYVEWEEDLYEVPVVPCDQPHTDEVYSTFDIEDGEYPGENQLQSLADERCLAEFESFVGIGYAASELDYYWSTPTKQTWTRWNDREVICIVFSYEDVTGTLRSAGR